MIILSQLLLDEMSAILDLTLSWFCLQWKAARSKMKEKYLSKICSEFYNFFFFFL